MWQRRMPRIGKFALSSLLLAGMLTLGAAYVFSSPTRSELIKTTVMGTGTQIGQRFNMTLDISRYSAPADLQVLSQAFERGQNQGLFDALAKMKPVGYCTINRNNRYSIRYIQMVQTPTGRKIQFITDRQLQFGEGYFDKQSAAFNLAAGEIDLDDADKTKSTGFFYPEAKVVVDKQGQLKFDLVAYPWKLQDIIDWNGTPQIN